MLMRLESTSIEIDEIRVKKLWGNDGQNTLKAFEIKLFSDSLMGL